MKSGKAREARIDRRLLALLVVILLLLLGALVALLVRGGGRDLSASTGVVPQADLAPPALSVSSAQLGKAYATNEVSANRTYGGRRLSVTGVVQGVTLDFTNEPIVSLNGADESNPVQISLDKRFGKKATTFAKGVIITVVCDKVVLMMGSPMLDDCRPITH